MMKCMSVKPRTQSFGSFVLFWGESFSLSTLSSSLPDGHIPSPSAVIPKWSNYFNQDRILNVYKTRRAELSQRFSIIVSCYNQWQCAKDYASFTSFIFQWHYVVRLLSPLLWSLAPRLANAEKSASRDTAFIVPFGPVSSRAGWTRSRRGIARSSQPEGENRPISGQFETTATPTFWREFDVGLRTFWNFNYSPARFGKIRKNVATYGQILATFWLDQFSMKFSSLPLLSTFTSLRTFIEFASPPKVSVMINVWNVRKHLLFHLVVDAVISY